MTKTKDIVCDSGSFISLTSSCLSETVYFLAKKHNVRFIVPPAVVSEAVDYPLNKGIKRYMFSAIKIKYAINDGILLKVQGTNTNNEAKRIMELANNLFYIRGKPLRLVQIGEAETLALALELGVENLLMDERTTRLLVEAPFSIKEHLEQEFKINVMVNRKNMTELSDKIGRFNVIRSSEIVAVAYEYGFFGRYKDVEKEAYEAALYKVRFSGCSIGMNEIREYLKQVK